MESVGGFRKDLCFGEKFQRTDALQNVRAISVVVVCALLRVCGDSTRVLIISLFEKNKKSWRGMLSSRGWF